MENIEDFYRKQESNDNAVKIAARIKEYNNNAATIRRLIPVAVSKIKANPPKSYSWVIIDGKECVSWSMYDNATDSSADESISILQNENLISIRQEYEQGKYVWKFVDYVYINFIGESDEAAQSDYHGGCGYYAKYCNKRQLGSYTISGLCRSMTAKFG